MTRVIQLTPHLSAGDAVSNDIFALDKALSSMGFETKAVCLGAAPQVAHRSVLLKNFQPKSSDIFLYHYSIGSELSEWYLKTPARKKFMVYHNITPAKWFPPGSVLANACARGREMLPEILKKTDFVFCDSKWNQEEISKFYPKSAVLPIVFSPEKFLTQAVDEEYLKSLSDGLVNILFVGRIAPNKSQENILHAFALYQRLIQPKSRLILAGAAVNTDGYLSALKDAAQKAEIQNVLFTGKLSPARLAACYKSARLFLCFSEHEGFCVPLLEAMAMNVPILAYSSCAVPDTLGGSGVLFQTKNFSLIAEMIYRMTTDEALRNAVLCSQKKRLQELSAERTLSEFRRMFLSLLDS